MAQYIKFEMPVLKSFIQKLQEEEDREVKKLMRKYVWPALGQLLGLLVGTSGSRLSDGCLLGTVLSGCVGLGPGDLLPGGSL